MIGRVLCEIDGGLDDNTVQGDLVGDQAAGSGDALGNSGMVAHSLEASTQCFGIEALKRQKTHIPARICALYLSPSSSGAPSADS